MARWQPTCQYRSFGTYARRFVDPALGFAIGWNYWLNWAVTLAVEVIAGALIMKSVRTSGRRLERYLYRGTVVHPELIFSTRALTAKVSISLPSIKVGMVLLFLVLGVLLITGVIGGGSPGTSNWTTGDALSVGGAGSVIAISMIAAFSFQALSSSASQPAKAKTRIRLYQKPSTMYFGVSCSSTSAR